MRADLRIRATAARRVLALAAVVACIVGYSSAASAQETKQTKEGEEVKKARFSAGQKAAVDPQTKKLRAPTRDEAAALDEGARGPAVESVRTVQLPGGTVMAELPEEFMDATVVRLNPDGTVAATCLRGAAAAAALAAKPVEPAPVLEEK